MLEHLMRYWALDWIGMSFTFLSMHYVGERKPIGFAMGMIGNVFWVIFGLLAQSWGVVIGNIVLFGLNFKGHRRWKS
ncbi:hypothetical protein EBR96_04855 [bacterium]|nr:hypothetical protein [bacterium]